VDNIRVFESPFIASKVWKIAFDSPIKVSPVKCKSGKERRGNEQVEEGGREGKKRGEKFRAWQEGRGNGKRDREGGKGT
jgi:hypothetical protein